VEAGDPAAVSADDQLRAAVSALTDPDLRRHFGAAARKSVLRRTWSTVCDELLAHYAEVIGAAAEPMAAPPALRGWRTAA
jgi:phosphatidylinositol alpha 1,6-mannosyltransferase